jgi:hypothetical protein
VALLINPNGNVSHYTGSLDAKQIGKWLCADKVAVVPYSTCYMVMAHNKEKLLDNPAATEILRKNGKELKVLGTVMILSRTEASGILGSR